MKKTKTETINMVIPLANDRKWNSFHSRASEVRVFRIKRYGKLTKSERVVLANYSYMLYKLLSKRESIKTNINMLRKFAKKYRELIDYVCDKTKGLRNDISWWLRDDVDMSEMSMYSGLPNRHTKNTYH